MINDLKAFDAGGATGFYSRHTVCRKTTYSPTTLWRRVRDGSFPAPVKISHGRVAWPAAAVDAWIAEKSAPLVAA